MRKLTTTLDVGQLGEDIVCNHLCRKGYTVVDRNFRKKWGEIDVIAVKGNVLHFIEVKANMVPRKFFKEGSAWRPEERVTREKLRRFYRTLESYLREHREAREWVIDVAAVLICKDTKQARIRFIENVTTA